MPTLVLEPGIDLEYERPLAEAASRAGWGVALVQHVPFSDMFVRSSWSGDHGDPVDASVLLDPNCWFHGSIQATKVAQQNTAWQVHAPWHALRCSSYYPHLRDRLFQQRHAFTTVGGLLRDRDQLFTSDLAVDGTLFVRPDACDKLFTGMTISRSDFDAGYKLLTAYDPPQEAPVVVAAPQKVFAEARFLVVAGDLVTGSYYKTGGQAVRLRVSDRIVDTARDMLGFCLAQGYDPAPSWVLDLAEGSDGWRILEVGATSCCGLYRCDLNAFVDALQGVLP